MSFIDLPVLQPPPALKVPTSLVVRYGYMRMMGEFAYDGDTRPGCGAKVVIRTRRGTELAEVMTTTCSNGGCAKSITRDKMMEFIDNSGGSEYPFTTDGKVLRIANPDDYIEQTRIESLRSEYVATCKTLILEMELPMKLVEVELILGGEMATFFFMSEHRVDFRALVKHLATRFRTRINLHQVGARDEARLVADYETCGQHCCCKQFLKVLKPINMGAAKMQKATLDPNKISGRCGRLKCCLRYEEETYEDLRRKLPRLGTRVRTAEGTGTVEETMILTQLVRVRLDNNNRAVAVANEELVERDLPALREDERQQNDMRSDSRPGPRTGSSPSERQPRRSNEPRVPGTFPQPPEDFTPPPPSEDSDGPETTETASPEPKRPNSPNNPPAQPGIGSLGRRRRRGNRGGGGSPPNQGRPSQ